MDLVYVVRHKVLVEGLSARKVDPAELFASSTFDLSKI